MMLRQLLRFILERRIKENFRFYKKYLSRAKKILDVGTGNGLTAHIISTSLSPLKITGLDIDNYLWPENKDIDLVIYKGKKIPFVDNSFDTVLLFFTLHHASRPENLLAETIRVSSQQLIIWEEVYQERWQQIIMSWYDRLVNFILLGYFISPPHFYKEDEWCRLFQKHQLKIKKALILSPIFPLLPTRALFVLEK